MKENIAYGFAAVMLGLAVVLCFLINIYLGFFILFFSLIVLWWIYGVRKKKVDSAMAKTAEETGLSFRKHPLRYGIMKGTYGGRPTEIKVHKDVGAFGGAGIILTSLTGKGAFAALDIRNFTGMRCSMDIDIPEKMLISEDPLMVAHRDEIYLMLPHVSSDADEIKRGLDRLRRTADELERKGTGR